MRENTTKIAGLDSLRFFAFLSIFIFHATDFLPKGYLGVDFFFVLSSFLLTYLVFKELEQKNHFSKKKFFIRRSLRIFPLYFLVVIFSLIGLPFLANYTHTSITLPENQLYYWLFLSNYETSDSIFALKFLWSIAVEEQFYLVFILFGFLFRKHFWVFVSLLFSAYLSYMIIAQQLDLSTYTNTLTHFSNFAIGMSAAYLFYHKITPTKILVSLLILSFCALLILDLHDIAFHPIISICFASATLLFIKASNSIKRFKAFKITEHLGGYTYGLYIYSGFVLTFGNKFTITNNAFYNFSIQFTILLIVAFMSYHFYEKHFLKLKKRFY
jgi:peptidoglycan/LPS O-acetylase OafA/YrhL